MLALDRLDLEVARGEVFGLLGPNGSGKTTAFKLLLGLARPTSGEARVLGCAPRQVEAHRRLGFLPEESYLYRFLDAEEALDFHGRLYGVGRAMRRARSAELLELVGLTDARRRPLAEYSKGMSRRIGLAQALMGDPELLLLDEPTAGMDPLGAGEVKALLRRLRAEGKTIVLASHLLADVEDVCDRVAILHRGALQVEGAVDELLASRHTLAVRLVQRAAERPDGLAQAEAVARLLEAAGEEVRDVAAERERLAALFARVVGAARAEGDSEPTPDGEAGA